jgi:phosphoribosyl-ATP pyrophosphohydrolase
VKKTPERKALEKLVMDCENYLVALDLLMRKPSVSLLERSRRIAHLSNFLNLQVDLVRYGVLGIDFRQDKPLTQRVARRAAKFLSDQKKAVADMGVGWQVDVAVWLLQFGGVVRERPTIPEDVLASAPTPMGTVSLRNKLLREETEELCKAQDEGELPHIAKEIADVIFVALGVAVTYGIDMQPVWGLVHASNMAKEGGHTRTDGKVLKPDGWQPPDIQAEIDRQGRP